MKNCFPVVLSLFLCEFVFAQKNDSMNSLGCYSPLTQEFKEYAGSFYPTVGWYSFSDKETERAYLSYYGTKICEIKRIKNNKIERNLTPVPNKKGKWGYQNAQGKYVIPAVFETARQFVDVPNIENQIAAVCFDGEWGYITNSGDFVAIGLQYADDINSAGKAMARINDLNVILAFRNQTVETSAPAPKEHEINYIQAYLFHSLKATEIKKLNKGYACKVGKDQWVLLSDDYDRMSQVQYFDIEDIGEDAILVKSANLYGVISNTDWSYVLPLEFFKIELIDNSYYAAESSRVIVKNNYAHNAYSLDGRLLLSGLQYQPTNTYQVVVNNTIDKNVFSTIESLLSVEVTSNTSSQTTFRVKAKHPFYELSKQWLPKNCDEIVSVIVEDGITSIAKHTFDGCTNLESIVLPKTLEEIDDYAFLNCDKLRDIRFPESIRRLGDHSFEGCQCLTSVTLPPKTKIGAYCFRFCKELSSFSFHVESVNPWDFVSVEDGVFEGCDNLVSFGYNLGNVGRRAFYNCKKLKEVNLSNTTILAEQCFGNCIDLTITEKPSRLNEFSLSAFDQAKDGNMLALLYYTDYCMMKYGVSFFKLKQDGEIAFYLWMMPFDKRVRQRVGRAGFVYLEEALTDDKYFDYYFDGDKVVLTEGYDFEEMAVHFDALPECVLTPSYEDGMPCYRTGQLVWFPDEDLRCLDRKYLPQTRQHFADFYDPSGHKTTKDIASYLAEYFVSHRGPVGDSSAASEMIAIQKATVWAKILGRQDAESIILEEKLRRQRGF